MAAASTAVLALPLAAAGWAAASDVSSAPAARRVRALWLAASGSGASAGLCAVPWLGAPGVLAAGCLLYAASAFARARSGALRAASALALLVSVTAIALPASGLAVSGRTAGTAGALSLRTDAAALGLTLQPRFDGWDAGARVQSFELSTRSGRATGVGALLRDSALAAPLIRGGTRHPDLVAELCERTLFAVPWRAPGARVLIAGIGGGLELQCALHHAAARVDVAEPSRAQRLAVASWLKPTLGAATARVRFVSASARVASRRGGRYDLVVVAGTRSKHVLPPGVLPIPEHVIETDAGLRALLAALTPGGRLWALARSEPAALRLANLARTALAGSGAVRPERHLVVHRDGDNYGVTVARSPLGLNQVLELHTAARARASAPRVENPALARLFAWPLSPPELVFTPGAAFANRFGALLSPSQGEAAARLARSYAFDLDAPTDNRPLFHELTRADRPDTWSAASAYRALPRLAALALLCAAALIALVVARAAPGLGLRAAVALAASSAAQPLLFALALHALGIATGSPELAFTLAPLALPAFALWARPAPAASALAVHALAVAAAVPVAPWLVMRSGYGAVAVAAVLLLAVAAALSWTRARTARRGVV
jgi:hypothetical protein